MKIEEIIQKIWAYISSNIIPFLVAHPVAVFIFLIILIIVGTLRATLSILAG